MLLSKDCEHSVVQLTRPVKLRRTPFRSRQSLRASIIYKGPVQLGTRLQSEEALPSADDQVPPPAGTCDPAAVDGGSTGSGHLPHSDNKMQGNTLLVMQLFITPQHIWDFILKLKQWQISTLNSSNNTGAVQYGTMQGPVQFHTRAGRWADLERRQVDTHMQII